MVGYFVSQDVHVLTIARCFGWNPSGGSLSSNVK